MESDNNFLKETPEPGANPQRDGSEPLRPVPQQKKAGRPIPPGVDPNQNAQDTPRITSKGRPKPNAQSGEARRAQARNQETSSRAPQRIQTAKMDGSTAERVQNNADEESNFESKDLRRTFSTPANENDHTSTFNIEHHFKQQHANLEQHYIHLELEHNELLRVVDSMKVKLEESEARSGHLQQRLEEASNTIFRLRPQRQEYTEGEIEEDYERLIKAIKNWVSVNCEVFLDDDLCGYEVLPCRRRQQGGNLAPFEEIIANFQSQSKQWTEAKEHVLVAVVMRFVYERILTQAFSVLLSPNERSILASIEEGLEDPRLQKDLPTIRAWRNDTITAVDNNESFANRGPSIQSDLTSDIHHFILGALSGENKSSSKQSLCKEVIAPAMRLAHKTQSASSIWAFRYSDYLAYKPGEFGSRLPNFLANVGEFRCINLSRRGKLLKPVSDLSTKEEQDNLQYVLDLFPGLYCQRVTAGSSPPLSTISQPILLVSFATQDTPVPTQQNLSAPLNPEISNQNRKTSPTRPISTDNGSGLINSVKNFVRWSE